jgi:Flp pilus assembly protein TadG
MFHNHRRQHAAGDPENQETRAAAWRRDRGRTRRGQSLVEAALVLPLIVLFLSVIVEGGLALNAWIRVNTAARDATRFALDEATPDDVGSLVLTKLSGINFGTSKEMSSTTNIDIFQINGTTTITGDIPNDSTHWSISPILVQGTDTPRVSRTTIKNRLAQQSGSDTNSIPFVIVEVDFKYTPLLSNIIAPGAQLPMSSYAIIQQQPNN